MNDKWTHRQATKERQAIDAITAEAEEKARQSAELRREAQTREKRLDEMQPEGWGG